MIFKSVDNIKYKTNHYSKWFKIFNTDLTTEYYANGSFYNVYYTSIGNFMNNIHVPVGSSVLENKKVPFATYSNNKNKYLQIIHESMFEGLSDNLLIIDLNKEYFGEEIEVITPKFSFIGDDRYLLQFVIGEKSYVCDDAFTKINNVAYHNIIMSDTEEQVGFVASELGIICLDLNLLFIPYASVGDFIANAVYNITFGAKYKKADIIVSCKIGIDEFRYSINPTFIDTIEEAINKKTENIIVKDKLLLPTYITTVGLYNELNQCLAVCKFRKEINSVQKYIAYRVSDLTGKELKFKLSI